MERSNNLTTFKAKLYLSIPNQSRPNSFEKTDEEFNICCAIGSDSSSLEITAEQEKDYCCDCYSTKLKEGFLNDREEDKELAKNIEDNQTLLNRLIIPHFKAGEVTLYPEGNNMILKIVYQLFHEIYEFKIELFQRDIENIEQKFERICKKYKGLDLDLKRKEMAEMDEKNEKEIRDEKEKINRKREKLLNDLGDLLKNSGLSDKEIKEYLNNAVGQIGESK